MSPPPVADLTVNEYLLDRAVMHAIHLERLKTGEVKKIVALLNRDVFPDLLARINIALERVASRGSNVGLHSQKQLQELAANINEMIRGGMRAVYGDFKGSLNEIAIAESQWQASVLSTATSAPALGIEIASPPTALLRSIVTDRPFQGSLLRDWFSGLAKTAQKRVSQQINIGLVQGQSVPEIVARLRGTRANGFRDGVLSGTRREVEAIVRTSVNHVVTNAREETYQANEDLIEGVQWRSTLDLRTTVLCMTLDGQVFPIGEGPRPPAHWGCRSKTVPVVKSFAKLGRELGIKLKDIPPGTRASMDGQVAGKLTYPEWLARQSVERQDLALGPERAALFRSGKVEIDRFIDDRGMMISLSRLKTLEGLD